MGRRSKLSEEQWVEVGKRLLEGASPSQLSKELTAQGFRISESSIRSHFDRKGQSTKTVQQMAGEIFDAEQAIKAAEAAKSNAQKTLQTMPAATQVATMTLVQRMRTMSESLAEAADVSARTALGLANKANLEQQKIDDAEPMKGSALKNTVLLQKAANEAAELPTRIIAAAANRDVMRRVTEDDVPPEDEPMTPERVKEGVRRMAFLLFRADHKQQRETT